MAERSWGLGVWSHQSGGPGAEWGQALGGGGAVTLCDRSRMAALIGSMTPWSAGQVGMV